MDGQVCICHLVGIDDLGIARGLTLPLGLVRLAYLGSWDQGFSFGVVVNADQLNHCV